MEGKIEYEMLIIGPLCGCHALYYKSVFSNHVKLGKFSDYFQPLANTTKICQPTVT